MDSSQGGHLQGDKGPTNEVKYLPMPRDRANPNARGGAITIQPKAPTERLDYYKSPSKKPKEFDLYDLLVDLEILESPKRGQGAPQASRTISKQVIEQCMASIKKVNEYLQGSTKTLEAELEKLGQDRVVRLYMRKNIEIACQENVHERIISDTVRNRNGELKGKLDLLEKLLRIELQKLDPGKFRLGLNITMGFAPEDDDSEESGSLDDSDAPKSPKKPVPVDLDQFNSRIKIEDVEIVEK